MHFYEIRCKLRNLNLNTSKKESISSSLSSESSKIILHYLVIDVGIIYIEEHIIHVHYSHYLGITPLRLEFLKFKDSYHLNAKKYSFNQIASMVKYYFKSSYNKTHFFRKNLNVQS